jgi:peptidoglycan hydrolase-like protein with peptidoglycan-binding domain
MNSAGDVLNVMRSLIGTHESPDGSNNAPPVTSWYPMIGAWCAMTVSYALVNGGHAPHVKFAYTPVGVAKFKSGEWGSFHDSPQPGDLVFYSFRGQRPDHVGMVEAVGSGGKFTTIEGNVGNSCKRLARSTSTSGLLGFGRPRYDGMSSQGRGGNGSPRTLAIGARGEDVKGLQAILAGAGLLPASGIDGDFGPKTKAAVIALQRNLGVTADGIVGPVTHAAIDALLRFLAAQEGHPTSDPRRDDLPMLRNGAKGDHVKLAQARLQGHGFDPGPVDGIFGDKTERAVRAFQQARGLEVDGVIGPLTWGALG